jgi:hypothetical protein
LQPNFFSKGGRSTARSPEFSVEVVVDTRSRSSARAGRAAMASRITSKVVSGIRRNLLMFPFPFP